MRKWSRASALRLAAQVSKVALAGRASYVTYVRPCVYSVKHRGIWRLHIYSVKHRGIWVAHLLSKTQRNPDLPVRPTRQVLRKTPRNVTQAAPGQVAPHRPLLQLHPAKTTSLEQQTQNTNIEKQRTNAAHRTKSLALALAHLNLYLVTKHFTFATRCLVLTANEICGTRVGL